MRNLLLTFLFVSQLLSAQDQSLDLNSYKGKLVYLDFWASWCTPCKLSFPWLNQLSSKYKDSGLEVIGINVDEDKKLADLFLKKYPANFKIMFNPSGSLAEKYAVSTMPYSVLIGRDGKIIKRHAGFDTKYSKDFDKYIAQVISGKHQKRLKKKIKKVKK